MSARDDSKGNWFNQLHCCAGENAFSRSIACFQFINKHPKCRNPLTWHSGTNKTVHEIYLVRKQNDGQTCRCLVLILEFFSHGDENGKFKIENWASKNVQNLFKKLYCFPRKSNWNSCFLPLMDDANIKSSHKWCLCVWFECIFFSNDSSFKLSATVFVIQHTRHDVANGLKKESLM